MIVGDSEECREQKYSSAAVIAASYLPLRRALTVNPVDVLRSE
jgi:hypothetical protein